MRITDFGSSSGLTRSNLSCRQLSKRDGHSQVGQPRRPTVASATGVVTTSSQAPPVS
jgi:hypothetical protein